MIESMGITEQCEIVHERMREKGFWDHERIPVPDPEVSPGRLLLTVANPSIYEEKLALFGTEVAEIVEARRDKDMVEEERECADLLIRLMDYCGARGFDLGAAYVAKMAVNADRPYLHGRAR